MAALTFLGASGGVGTTQLAALSIHVLATHGLRTPSLVSENPAQLARRVGELPHVGELRGKQLADAGRYSREKAESALERGNLALVAAATEVGTRALDQVLRDLSAAFGVEAERKVVVAMTFAFGRPAIRQPDTRISVPFDRRLADTTPLTGIFSALHPRTRAVLRNRWLPVLRSAYPDA